MNEISEKIFNEELNKLFLVKIQFREKKTRLSTTLRSKIQGEEIQNAHHSSHKESLNLEDDNYWKPLNGQIKLNEREYICVADWEWRTIFIKKAMQEVAQKLKIWKDAAFSKKILKSNKDWKNFPRSMIRNHEYWFFSSSILTILAVMTYLRSSSNSYYLKFKKAQPRSWNAAKYTREYETCSTRSWWIIQLFKKFGNTIGNRWRCRGFWEKKELRIVGAINTFTLLFS